MSAATARGSATQSSRTLFEKIWQRHVVVDRGDGYQLLYVDRHLMHDGSWTAFETLRERGARVRRPELALATLTTSRPASAFALDAVLAYAALRADADDEATGANPLLGWASRVSRSDAPVTSTIARELDGIEWQSTSTAQPNASRVSATKFCSMA